VQNAVEVRKFAEIVDDGEAEAIELARELTPTGCSLTSARAENLPSKKAWR